MSHQPRVAEIQAAVARQYGVPLAMMRAPSGRGVMIREYARPRQIAMCLATRLTDHSLTRIGHFFGGRDHSTVLFACDQVEKRCSQDARLHASMREITLELVRQ